MIRNDSKTWRRSKRRARSPHSGFTIIELMVSMTVVGILLALLLPAVQQSRATARRFTCTNNLRQVGLANHNFLDAHGHFPFSALVHMELLPYLEQQALYDKMSSMDQTQRDLLKGDLPVYQCPADSLVTGWNYSVSYLLNHGTIPFSEARIETGSIDSSKFDGMFAVYRLEKVTDGTSNTAFYSERLRRIIRGHSNDYLNTNQPNRFPWLVNLQTQTVDALADACSDPRSRRTTTITNFATYSEGKISITPAFYDHIATPNLPLCAVEETAFFTSPATSLHSGGVNVLLVDGSVRFVSENISRDVWRAFGTRNGGEPISDF